MAGLHGRNVRAWLQWLGEQRVMWTLSTTTAASCDFLFLGVEIGRRPGCLLTRTFVRYGEGGEVEAVGEEAKEGDGFEA